MYVNSVWLQFGVKNFLIEELLQTLFYAARYEKKNGGHHFLYSFILKISNVSMFKLTEVELEFFRAWNMAIEGKTIQK